MNAAATATKTTTPEKVGRIKLPPVHAAQASVRAAFETARFMVLSCGRRWGKTMLAVEVAIAFASTVPGFRIWWVAPTYELAEIGWDTLKELLAPLIECDLVRVTKSKRRLLFVPTGATISVKTANSKSGLRGRGLDLLIVDEAAFVEREVWTKQLRPTLIDRRGKALIISTPAGMESWFYELWLRGQDTTQKRFRSFQFPTISNPYIEEAEIEEAREQMPEDAFRQEVLAEFLASDAGVFRNLDALFSKKGELRDEGFSHHKHVIGWDIAKLRDWSAWVVIDVDEKSVVHVRRERGLDYPAQVQILGVLQRKFPGIALLDSTGVGEPVLDMVSRAGIRAEGYKFTPQTKRLLVSNAVVSAEREALHVPFDERTNILHHEMKVYRYQIGKAGQVTYGAPPGFTDDVVTAFMLAVWAMTQTRVTLVHGPQPATASYFGRKAMRGL